MTPNGKPSRKLKIPCANNTCGFDPHHRHKKETPPACLGEFLFLSAACERVEQHGPAKECSGNVNRPHLPVRMVYRSGNGTVLFCAAASAFYLLRPLRVPTVPFRLIPPLRKGVLPAVFVARLSREWPFVLPKSRTLPGKKHRKTASAIYSAVSYRFYNVFCKKSFTNEFQKHII